VLAKYRPVTCSSSGTDAKWIDVAAPWIGDFMKGRRKGRNIRWTVAGSSAPKDVLATPGCKALDVTEVPLSLLASS